MTKQVEFWFDFVSPMSYIAYHRLPGLVERTGASVVFRPMLLGGVFQETGNAPPSSMMPTASGMTVRRLSVRRLTSPPCAAQRSGTARRGR